MNPVLKRITISSGILVGALGANLLLLVMIGVLTNQHSSPPKLIDPVGVSLVSLAPPEPPAPEEIQEPAPPPPQSKPDFAPDLAQPSFGDFGSGGLAVNLNIDNLEIGQRNQEFIFDSVDLDQPPRALAQVAPEYPFKAREQGIEGFVAIKILVKDDGTVGQVNILKSKPEGLFEDAVRRSIANWKFQPGSIGGDSVTSWIVTTIRFDLS